MGTAKVQVTITMSYDIDESMLKHYNADTLDEAIETDKKNLIDGDMTFDELSSYADIGDITFEIISRSND